MHIVTPSDLKADDLENAPTQYLDLWASNRVAGPRNGAVSKHNVEALLQFFNPKSGREEVFDTRVIFPEVQVGDVESWTTDVPAAWHFLSVVFKYEERVAGQVLQRMVAMENFPTSLRPFEVSWVGFPDQKGVFECSAARVLYIQDQTGKSFVNSVAYTEYCGPDAFGEKAYVQNSRPDEVWDVVIIQHVIPGVGGGPPYDKRLRKLVRNGSMYLGCSNYGAFGPQSSWGVESETLVQG